MSDTLGGGRTRDAFADFPMSRLQLADWNEPQARAAPEPGQCYLKYSADGRAAKDGATACIPNGGGNASGGYADCAYEESTDVQNSAGGASAAALGRAGCCAACAADARCKASVYVDATGNPYGIAPVKVSRATTRADAAAAFYVTVFGARVIHNVTGPDGTRAVTLKLPDTAGGKTLVHLQLWQPPPEAVAAADDCHAWTVAKWESYLLATHEAAMRTPTCGMDRWLDNHFSYDCGDERCDVKTWGPALDKAGVRWRLDPFMGSKWFVYSYDPTGMGVELHFDRYTGAPATVTVPPSCIHGGFANGTCAGQEAGQCT